MNKLKDHYEQFFDLLVKEYTSCTDQDVIKCEREWDNVITIEKISDLACSLTPDNKQELRNLAYQLEDHDLLSGPDSLECIDPTDAYDIIKTAYLELLIEYACDLKFDDVLQSITGE